MIRCKLFGHKWGAWIWHTTGVPLGDWLLGANLPVQVHRRCERCGVKHYINHRAHD